MSWSYDVAALQTSLKDQIRLKLGDTDETDPVLQDEEIMFYVGDATELSEGLLVRCIDACLSKIAGLPEYKLGPYQESHAGRLSMWKAMKDELEANAFSQHSPVSKNPITAPIFSYDLMSTHCCGEYKDES